MCTVITEGNQLVYPLLISHHLKIIMEYKTPIYILLQYAFFLIINSSPNLRHYILGGICLACNDSILMDSLNSCCSHRLLGWEFWLHPFASKVFAQDKSSPIETLNGKNIFKGISGDMCRVRVLSRICLCLWPIKEVTNQDDELHILLFELSHTYSEFDLL